MNEYLGLALAGAGIIYNLFACLGLVRLPDLYTRLQSSTKAVTMGTCLILIGIAVYAGSGPTIARTLLVMVFVLLTAPTAAHAIARGAHSSGIRVERVTAEGLIGRTIESELWDRIRVGDREEKDRFQLFLGVCPIYDLEGSLTARGLFARIAPELGELTGAVPGEIVEKLLEREAEATTALAPGVGIPHIQVAGEGIFAMMAVRVRGGVRFSEETPDVRAVFVLAGSTDQWHFHLRSLAGIAGIVREEDFSEQWERAADGDDLRRLLLRRVEKRPAKNGDR